MKIEHWLKNSYQTFGPGVYLTNRPGILLKPSTSKNSGGNPSTKTAYVRTIKNYEKNTCFLDYLRSTTYITTATTSIVTNKILIYIAMFVWIKKINMFYTLFAYDLRMT